MDESSCAGLSVASSPGAQPPPCPEPEVNEHLPGSSSVDPACVRYVPPGSRGASPPPGIAYRSYPPGMPYAYGPPGRVTYVFGSFGAEQMAQGPWMQAQPPPGAAYPGPPPAPGLGCGSPPRFGGASPPPHAELHYPIPGSPPGYYMIPGPGYRSGGASPTYLGAYPFSGMAAPRGGSDDGMPGGSPTGSVDYTTTAFAGLGLERVRAAGACDWGLDPTLGCGPCPDPALGGGGRGDLRAWRRQSLAWLLAQPLGLLLAHPLDLPCPPPPQRSSSRDGLSRTSSSSSLRRASARIARSTRAGGAYNAEEVRMCVCVSVCVWGGRGPERGRGRGACRRVDGRVGECDGPVPLVLLLGAPHAMPSRGWATTWLA